MTWQEIINNKDLANLPFKIETNEFGQMVMSPKKFIHGIYQARLASLLKQFLMYGFTSIETSIATPKGVKVPDVAWSSYAFLTPTATNLICPKHQNFVPKSSRQGTQSKKSLVSANCILNAGRSRSGLVI